MKVRDWGSGNDYDAVFDLTFRMIFEITATQSSNLPFAFCLKAVWI